MALSFVYIYVCIPCIAMYFAFKKALEGDKFVNREVFMIDSKFLPFYRLWEHVGEALPQLIISLTFISKNYPFIYAEEQYFEGSISFPISILSAIFSGGSLAYGLYSGCLACGACIAYSFKISD